MDATDLWHHRPTLANRRCRRQHRMDPRAAWIGADPWTVGWGGHLDQVPTGTTAPLEGIAAVDAMTVWVVGGNGTILKTTSGGTPVSATPTLTSTLTSTPSPSI